MTMVFKDWWQEVGRVLFFRPKRVQVAALCYRSAQAGREVLLVTSRDTGRWILPKGWPINGKDGPQSALQEAWEEAGVAKAKIAPEPVGSYEYVKRLDSGGTVPVETEVYLTEVEELALDYPECAERTRTWVSASQAAGMVQETGLQDILRKF